ncbi:MAG: methyltransferase domain-containing protein, partial [Thaumarchaeota archaeon]|nr:methyltransferase domain-containing protein [Nitrososphaerota archaeon]
MEQEERYDVDGAYNESFFGWDNNALQQQQLAQYLVPKIVERFRPKYVLDIGCGSGQWLDEYRKYKVRARGIESASAAWVSMSKKTQKNVVKWDLRNKL